MVRNLNAILPIGTKVVLKDELRDQTGTLVYPKGMVGTVMKSPTDHTHSYLLRFVDGHQDTFKRNQFTIHTHYQSEGLEEASPYDESLLYQHVIYRCVVGSQAYGLAEDTSDFDRRGIYLPPADLHWSLFGVPEQLDNKATEEHYWELQKFITLALKANPNVLECLYTPLVEDVQPLAQELLEMREKFLSQLIYQTYNGYVESQFRKLQKDIENYGEIRWKHAMHLIRLLLSGIIALQEGYIPVRVDDYRERLLDIRRKAVPWEEVNAWRLDLHRQFNAAIQNTHLPERPDYAAANTFLIHARRQMVK